MDEITKIAAEADSKNQVVEDVKPEGDKFDKMSNSDALKQAISDHKGAEAKSEPTSKPEVKAAVESDPEPPAEFSAAGKKAWKEKDFSGVQKEYSRIHTARTQEISRAQTEARQAREEAKTWRDLGEMAKPYIEARGTEGVTPQAAMMEALALIQEFKKGDPATVKAELKKIGIDLDQAGTPKEKSHVVDEIGTLRDSVKELLNEREAIKFHNTAKTFDAVFAKLNESKTRTGEVPFPDLLDNSEKGMEFAQELGSLTQDARFQAGVLRRFPDADLTVLVREAYKYLGGRVSGEPVKVSPEKDKAHSDKARRAAASTPGRVVARNEQSNLNGKLGSKEAIRAALAYHRGGH